MVYSVVGTALIRFPYYIYIFFLNQALQLYTIEQYYYRKLYVNKCCRYVHFTINNQQYTRKTGRVNYTPIKHVELDKKKSYYTLYYHNIISTWLPRIFFAKTSVVRHYGKIKKKKKKTHTSRYYSQTMQLVRIHKLRNSRPRKGFNQFFCASKIEFPIEILR